MVHSPPLLWIAGLPGSGKSTIARLVRDALVLQGLDAVHLAMDDRRKAYIPTPKYTAEEREQAYALLVEEALALQRQGKVVLLDATAHRRAWRDAARAQAPRFLEVIIQVPPAVAMAREAARPEGLVQAQLYRRALERRRTGREDPGLGEVPGVDVPFEMPTPGTPGVLVLDSAVLSPQEAAGRILETLAGWGRSG
ncbi:MAG: adenylyl-sulfate kinase [Desulfovibrio sp.]|nr:adenylyl-sulfate kinase [Desulfovibrio sp.]MCA1987183.1 adenylyl-sulfate kinase [Desulfovibrio sp.]